MCLVTLQKRVFESSFTQRKTFPDSGQGEEKVISEGARDLKYKTSEKTIMNVCCLLVWCVFAPPC